MFHGIRPFDKALFSAFLTLKVKIWVMFGEALRAYLHPNFLYRKKISAQNHGYQVHLDVVAMERKSLIDQQHLTALSSEYKFHGRLFLSIRSTFPKIILCVEKVYAIISI